MTTIVWPMILVRLFYPLHTVIDKETGRDRTTISAALSTLSGMLLTDLPVAYLVFPVITEIINGYQFAMTWVQGGGLQRLPKLVARLPQIGSFSQELLG